MKVPKRSRYAHIRTADGRFINGTERIFTTSEENMALMIHVSNTPVTSWLLEENTDGTFTVTTEIDGLIYSIQDGAPGTGAPWGIAYLAPIIDPIGSDVVFRPYEQRRKHISSDKAVWHPDYQHLCVQSDVLMWSNDNPIELELIYK